jgi:hypothetical protein
MKHVVVAVSSSGQISIEFDTWYAHVVSIFERTHRLTTVVEIEKTNKFS